MQGDNFRSYLYFKTKEEKLNNSECKDLLRNSSKKYYDFWLQ